MSRVVSDQDVPLPALRIGAKLGSGGQGEVRVVLNRPGLVFKRYFHPASVDGAALTRLVEFPRSLSAPDADHLHRHAAWPLARVVDGAHPAGFLMRQVPADFIGRTAAGPQLRELQYLLYRPKPMWGDITPLDNDGRAEVLHGFARLVQILHSRRMVVGDISMRNLLWKPGSTASVYLIDCDGTAEEGTRAVLEPSETPDWTDPLRGRISPSLPRPLDLDTDRYKLALVAGRVLAGDPVVRPGEELRLPGDLDPSIAASVRACFAEAAGARGSRPAAERWLFAARGRQMQAVGQTVVTTPPATLPKADMDGRGTRTSVPFPRPEPPR